jgi:hypothetical protein
MTMRERLEGIKAMEARNAARAAGRERIMKRHVYRVWGSTKKGGYQLRAMDIAADNQREAKDAALAMWYEHHEAHMFDVHALRWDDRELEFNYWTKCALADIEPAQAEGRAAV